MKKYLYQLATDQRNDLFSELIKIFLYILSVIYGFFVGILRFLYWLRILKVHKLDCKVISVGNITLGGTGKTPMVLLLANYLRRKGHSVGVLIRGYGADMFRSTTAIDYKSLGDEAVMLMQSLKDIPVFVGRDRVKNGKEAIERYGLDTLILDDGFQHWRLYRDLDVVLIDSFSSFGNRHILPRGILREPLRSLRRADIFVLTKADAVESTCDVRQFLKDFYPNRLILDAVHKPVSLDLLRTDSSQIKTDTVNLSELKDKSICALSSIGDPMYFENMLKKLGADIDLAFRFPDHYKYREKDLQKIYLSCQRQNIGTIVTTQKDAVRLEKVMSQIQSLNIQIFILKIEIKILKDEKTFIRRVDSIYLS